jgi:glycosyltransferase involved in cell wall biosynthesis
MRSTEKIRVLHFLSHGAIGGQERAQYQLLRAFVNDEEFELAAAIGRSEGYYVDLVKGLNIEVIDLHLSSGYDIVFARKHLDALKQFDIHHLHDPSPNHILISVLSGGNTKRVLTRRGGLIDYRRYGLKRRVKYLVSKLLIKRCFDGYSGNTQTAAEFVRRSYNIKSNISVLYNGIDFALLQPRQTKNELLAALRVSNSDYKVGTACHLVPLKRVDVLIKAFGICRIKSKKLIIFGKGPEQGNLERLVSFLGLGTKVLFCGEVPDMMNYYQILDCFVLASGPEESFGNAVVESMYLKVPTIIMSDASGLREHITDGVTGFVASDEYDLAQKMEFVSQHSEDARRTSDNASSYVVNKYSVENMKVAYKQFYREALR